MQSYLTFGARYPWLVILLLSLSLFWCIPQFQQLQFQISAEDIMLDDSEERAFYNQYQSIFGHDDGVTLFLSDERLLFSENISLVRETLKNIESIDFVSATSSLFSLNHIRVDEEDFVHSSPYLEHAMNNEQDRSAWLKVMLNNNFIADNLLSDDGQSMAIWIKINSGLAGNNADETISNEINRIIRPLQAQLDKAYLIGSPILSNAISDKIINDQQFILPGAIAFLLFVLALVLRRLNGAIIPLITALFSIAWLLAFMVLLDIPINVMTSVIPALLIVIGSTEDVHLLSEFYRCRNKGLSTDAALEQMSKNMGLAVFLTYFTTALGFLSITVNPIPLMQSFGLAAAVGLSFNFIITSLLVPALLKVFSRKQFHTKASSKTPLFEKVALSLLYLAQHYRTLILILIPISLMLALASALRIQVNNDPMAYFKPGDETLQNFNYLQDKLTGGHSFSIILDGQIEGTFAKARYLQDIQRLQEFMASQNLFSKSMSFADIIARVNIVMLGEDGEKPYLPEIDAEVNDFLLFLKPRDIKEFVSEDLSRARIQVRHKISASEELDRALNVVQQYMDENLPRGVSSRFTGVEILTNEASSYMTIGQAYSLTLVFATIWLLLSLVFVNRRAGLVALIPNLIPIILLFGMMGYLSISMDTSSAMVATIALGICIDNTMHFMVRFHHNSRLHRTPDAIKKTVVDEATPIFGTSLALIAGFSLLSLSNFPPLGVFGLLSAMVILTALISTFLVMPILLASIKLITLWDMLDLNLRTKVRNSCPLFKDMSLWQIKKLILQSEIKTLEAGETLFREGETGQEMYIILDGAVEAWGTENGTFRALSQLGEGDMFGETALMEKKSRTVSIVTLEKTDFLVLRWDSVLRIKQQFPRIATRLFFNLSHILGTRLSRGATG